MAIRLRNASVEARNAAFTAIFKRLEDLITLHAPGMFAGRIRAGLESPEGRKELLAAVDEGLDAAYQIDLPPPADAP